MRESDATRPSWHYLPTAAPCALERCGGSLLNSSWQQHVGHIRRFHSAGLGRRSPQRGRNQAARDASMPHHAHVLQLRPNCEWCDKDLPPTARDAMICTFECTFCLDCVETNLHDVCPNCGGGFTPRPIRLPEALTRYPPSTVRVLSPGCASDA